eukprot:TRINITY_DN3934_c0_g1_i1.p1 TRINITY_DN3934_c0_g1~~TRINITY_DN3934_c0_g1_i1.p1  ORF type:complete len:306 (-),score=126.97 TRINITY_DN3934_c0_g1_i1:237-1154(-)
MAKSVWEVTEVKAAGLKGTHSAQEVSAVSLQRQAAPRGAAGNTSESIAGKSSVFTAALSVPPFHYGSGFSERRRTKRPPALALFADMTVAHPVAFRSDMAYKLECVEENGFLATRVATHSASFSSIEFGPAARTLLTLPNAGGNSKASEALSLELLVRQLNAKLQCTEMELEYFPYGSKITDYSVRISGEVVGVSVTRAMKYCGEFTHEDAETLLEKKLYGVVASSKAVLKKYRWSKQILHVLVERDYMVPILESVWRRMCRELQSNTVVVASVCETAPWVFYNSGFTQEEYELVEGAGPHPCSI